MSGVGRNDPGCKWWNMTWWWCVGVCFGAALGERFDVNARPELRVVLVKPDGDFLFDRLALYWNVDRHFLGPSPLFVLFFHCDTELAAS